MKKIIVTILSVIYLTASVGAPISIHYCMGKLVNWTLSQNQADHCSKCGMATTKTTDSGCCSDETMLIKSTQDQTSFATIQIIQVPIGDLPANHIPTIGEIVSSQAVHIPLANGPPPKKQVAVYVFNCSFLI